MLSLPPVNDTAVAMAGDNVDKASFAQVQSPGSVKRRSVGDLLVILDASTVQHPLAVRNRHGSYSDLLLPTTSN